MTSRGLSRWSRYSAIFCARSGEPEPAYSLISPYILISRVCCDILAPYAPVLLSILCLLFRFVQQEPHGFIRGEIPVGHVFHGLRVFLLSNTLHKTLHQRVSEQ